MLPGNNAAVARKRLRLQASQATGCNVELSSKTNQQAAIGGTKDRGTRLPNPIIRDYLDYCGQTEMTQTGRRTRPPKGYKPIGANSRQQQRLRFYGLSLGRVNTAAAFEAATTGLDPQCQCNWFPHSVSPVIYLSEKPQNIAFSRKMSENVAVHDRLTRPQTATDFLAFATNSIETNVIAIAVISQPLSRLRTAGLSGNKIPRE